MKRLLSSLIMVMILFGCFISSVSARMTDYGIIPREAYIEVGQEFQFEPYYETDDGSIRNPWFYYENREQDSQGFTLTDSGLVKGLKEGDYNIECGFMEPGVSTYYYSIARLHVLPPVESIDVPQAEYTIYCHEWELGSALNSLDPKITIKPDSYKANYKVDNENIVKVDNSNQLMPMGFGITSVSAIAGKQTRTFKVNVVDKEKTDSSKFSDGTIQDPIFPVSSEETVPAISNNYNRENYTVWSSPVNSYLVNSSNGYMRVENVGSKVVIDYFDNDFKPIAEKQLDFELPKFGGFYNGKSNFFLVFGQNNPDEDDNCEVIRIVKYDKNWNRLGAASVNGANTYIPFEAGSLRMAEYKNLLYIRTCHEMYESSDGLHHQANLTIEVDIPSMDINSTNHEVSNSGTGYVSHSFNQFLLVDKGDILALDHGDAYPRSALLGMYGRKAGVPSENGASNGYYSNNILSFSGETGDNNTNASVGGLEASENYYLTVGNSADQSGTSASEARNIYVSVTPKTNFGKEDCQTGLVWLTNNDGSMNPSTPHLVKFNKDLYLVVWSLNPQQSYMDNSPRIQYAFIDGNGTLKGEVQTLEAKLSDCKPVVKNGKAVWYVTDGKSFVFYTLDSEGNLDSKNITDKPVPIYRLYNDITGEHLYTSSLEEYQILPGEGWSQEDVGWEAPGSGTPVYRLYNPAINDHLFTTNEAEYDILIKDYGWYPDNNGEPLFYSGGDVPIYRLYNPSNSRHLLTRNEDEYNLLKDNGWEAEGVKLNALS